VTDETTTTPTTPGAADTAPQHRRAPSWLASTLVAIATLVAVVSVFSTWVRVAALDTDGWVSMTDELLQEPEMQEALSAYLVDQVFQEVDAITAEIADGLPVDLRGLAGPLTAALRGPATTWIEQFVGSEQFRTAWLTSNRVAHQQLVNILRDENGPLVSTANGTVSVDLGPVVRTVVDELGFSGRVLDELSPDAGVFTLFQSDDLDAAQTAVRVLDFMAWFLLLVVVALYAAAVYVSDGRRLTVLRSVGYSLIGAGVFVLALQAIVVRRVLDAIVADPGNRSIAGVAAYVGTGLIRQIAWSGIVYGVLIAGFALLLGAQQWAVAARRFVTPAFNASPGMVVAGTVGLVMVLIWWSPGRAFESWATGLTVIVLIVAAVVALRRITAREFGPVAIPETAG
jgi:hypothetical protein